MTSQLNVDTIVDKAGSGGSNVKMANTSTYVSDGGAVSQNTVQGLAKAWNYFDGTGTVAIDNSFNVSSLVDSSTGQYASVFTNNMLATQYPNTGHSRHDGGVNALFSTSNKDLYPPITSSCGIDSFSSDGNQAGTDSDQMSQVIHGDLA